MGAFFLTLILVLSLKSGPELDGEYLKDQEIYDKIA